MIKQASLHTHGAAGSAVPSGVDAYAWRWMCSSFRDASVGLYGVLASVACRCITTTEVNSMVLLCHEIFYLGA